MMAMSIQAIVFDIGGVLEITPDLGVAGTWESTLGLAPGELNKRMEDAWRGGSIGTISEADVHRAATENLGLDERRLSQFMADLWREYLGTANTELIEYARGLRPRYRTGILSNSFVGAREREQAAYGFEDLVDEIIYSHECGMSKPDPGIYALTCARLAVEPAQLVFLDDSERCVEGARQAGIHAVLYSGNAQAIGDIEDLLALLCPARPHWSVCAPLDGRQREQPAALRLLTSAGEALLDGRLEVIELAHAPVDHRELLAGHPRPVVKSGPVLIVPGQERANRIEREPGLLGHADEHDTAQRVQIVAALPAAALLRRQEADVLPVAQGRRRHAVSVSDRPDRNPAACHHQPLPTD